MRKAAFLLVLILFSAVPFLALAGETTIVTTPAEGIYGVMILDDDNMNVCTTLSQQVSGTLIDWTVEINPGTSDMGTIFVRNANGNWTNTGRRFPLSAFMDSGDPDHFFQPEDSFYPDYDDEYVSGFDSPIFTDDAPWPVISYDPIRVSFKPLSDGKRNQSYTGPATSYPGGGAYKTGADKVTSCYALYTEGDMLFVELNYPSVGLRRLYFKDSCFENISNIPYDSHYAYPAKIKASSTARFGPGAHYDLFKDARINAGASINVFFQEDEWVFAEFACDKHGTVRGWFPAKDVEAE